MVLPEQKVAITEQSQDCQANSKVMHQSIPAAPISPPPPLPMGYYGASARLISPGGGAFANFALPGGRPFAYPGLFPSF